MCSPRAIVKTAIWSSQTVSVFCGWGRFPHHLTAIFFHASSNILGSLEASFSILRNKFQQLSPACGCGVHLHVQPEGCHSGLLNKWLLSIPGLRSKTESKHHKKAQILPTWTNSEGERIILLPFALTYRIWACLHINYDHKEKFTADELWGLAAWLVGW